MRRVAHGLRRGLSIRSPLPGLKLRVIHPQQSSAGVNRQKFFPALDQTCPGPRI